MNVSALSSGKDRKRVVLAGFGVVGGGVYARLRARPETYDVVGIVCRNPARHAGNGTPAGLFVTDPQSLPPYDILVEAIGGLAPAGDIVLGALARGADVVTANKTLMSRRFADIEATADASGSRVLYSAAVGGGAPMLETVDEVAARSEIVRLDAVLNGTTNFVLERLGEGASLETAIREAQDKGFAEADPSADIDGIDAAEKLALLARRAFGADIDPASIRTDPLAALAPETIAAAARAGAPYKQTASARKTARGLRLAVRLKRVEAGDPLARPQREENCLVITCINGETTTVHGKGAGRDPTADSAFGDIERLAHAPAHESQPRRPANWTRPVNESATSAR